MMRSASRQALDSLRGEQHKVMDGRSTARTLSSLAEELYSVAGLLVAQPRLRRALGDPATKSESRTALLEGLLGDQVGAGSRGLAVAAVALRWSSPWDLTDAIEQAGDDALFAAAEKDSALDGVEDELFRLERVLDGDGNLTALLDDFTADKTRRTELLDSLVEGKVSPITLALLRHAVVSERKRSITLAIDDLLEQAAVRRERSVARVMAAVPLTSAQQDRLAAALTHMYGRAISVRTALDPSLRGGLVVRVGDEVIDGSIATRFLGARAALSG